MILGLNAAGRLRTPKTRAAYATAWRTTTASIEPTVDLMLPTGDLMVLSGKARWEMLHRVVREAAREEAQASRISASSSDAGTL